MTNSRPLTTGQAPEDCHVSQATIVRWINDGPLGSNATEGSDNPIPGSGPVAYLERHGVPVNDGQRTSHREGLGGSKRTATRSTET